MGINYAEIAKCIASASKDPRYKVGAVIYDANGNIRSTGYNGAPRGVLDKPERYIKPAKALYIVHAEANAIAQAARMGVSLDECCMLIWGKQPCANCAALIIQAGIKSVLFQREDIALSNYNDSFAAASTMLAEAGVQVTYLKEK